MSTLSCAPEEYYSEPPLLRWRPNERASNANAKHSLQTYAGEDDLEVAVHGGAVHRDLVLDNQPVPREEPRVSGRLGEEVHTALGPEPLLACSRRRALLNSGVERWNIRGVLREDPVSLGLRSAQNGAMSPSIAALEGAQSEVIRAI